MRPKTENSQAGAVLIISLILLVVASLTALASMRDGQLQSRMTANHNNRAIALMAAETGASRFWQWLADEHDGVTPNWEEATWQDDWQDVLPTADNSGETNNAGLWGHFWIAPSDVTWQATSVIVKINGVARADGTTLARTIVELELLRPGSLGSEFDPAFGVGMLADQNIVVNGASTFNGSIHANGDFRNTSGGSLLNNIEVTDPQGNATVLASTVSAQGVATFGGTPEAGAHVVSSAPLVDVPSAGDFIDANRNGDGVIQSCSIPAGDGGGATYFCDGNLTVGGGNYSNVTIMASGNVTHNGSSALGDEGELNLALIAAGDITINGSNDTYGVYWSGGDVTQNGSSILGGSIVAGGGIRRNGQLSYTQVKNLSADLNLPATPLQSRLSIARWTERRSG